MELIEWLVAQGYAPTTQRNQVRAAARLGSWMVAEDLKLGDLDAERRLRMVREDNERFPEHSSANENVPAVLRFLRETGRLRPACVVHTQASPAEACLGAWLRFLEVEQGRGVSWIYKAPRAGAPFLELIQESAGELRWDALMSRWPMTSCFVLWPDTPRPRLNARPRCFAVCSLGQPPPTAGWRMG